MNKEWFSEDTNLSSLNRLLPVIENKNYIGSEGDAAEGETSHTN